MSKKIKLIILILIVASPLSSTYAQKTRGEIQRFTLLHDRKLIERDLIAPSHSQFLDLDISISSGLRELISNASSNSDSNQSAAQKRLAALRDLSKSVNTEKYVQLFVELGLPLPDIKIGDHRLYPSLFYQASAALMLSIDNQEDVTDPRASTYLRQQFKRGAHFHYKKNDQTLYGISLYQLTRSDATNTITSSDLASDGEYFNLDSLDQDHEFLALDLSYSHASNRGKIEAGLKELKLMSMSDHTSLYGSSPALFTQYTWYKSLAQMSLKPFVGIHYRRWYPLHRGIYAGFHLKSNNEMNPFSLSSKIDNQFIALIPRFKLKWLHFSYALKAPYRNPQDNLWVSTIHNIKLSIPFP